MLRGPDPFGSFAPDTLPGAYMQHMRGQLTDSTRPTFRNATFSARRDLYVTLFDCLVRFVHRQMATPAQIASTTPNGHAPCRNP